LGKAHLAAVHAYQNSFQLWRHHVQQSSHSPLLFAQVAESTVEDLAAVQDDVALKLSLWTSSAEFEDVVAGWRGCHFEALDLAGMEETMAR
jgi:hypothetical protein